MFALIDCNNFYASCERLFRPDLQGKPIVVLSNNDGCVIARSNEAKALKIKMSEPYFKIKAQCEKHNIHVFSSNYALYGDLSHRVMYIIKRHWQQSEIYSIDEAFLDLTTLPAHQLDDFCLHLQQTILKSTGIPTSIGIGKTKTLAKIANHLCKKKLNTPVFNIQSQPDWLKHIDIRDVWGVGQQWAKKLGLLNIHTASDLAKASLSYIRQHTNVVLMQTAMELRGVVCYQIQDTKPNQRILSSRSFGEMQTDYEALAQSVSSHVALAYVKLRAQGLRASRLSVFIKTNRFRGDLPQANLQTSFNLIHPSDDIRLLTHIAKRGLSRLFKMGFHYKKVGIRLDGLVSHRIQQGDLFHQPSDEALNKKNALLATFDDINQKFGRHTIKLAAEGFNKPWAMRSDMQSPHYTTQWTDLPVIKNGT